MATYTDAKNNSAKGIPSTNEVDMLADAKSYAKTEFTSIKTLLESLKVKVTDEDLAKAWIKVKYDQIVESRTKRVTLFD